MTENKGSGKTKHPKFRKPSLETSRRMKRIRSSHTGLEKAMAHLLKELGLKYTFQPRIFGRPDFRILRTSILIFCDSSFWHGRRTREITGKAFKKNRAFWTAKLLQNKKRDERINTLLRRNGWAVLRFWDDDILKCPEKVKRRIRRKINEKCRGN